MKGESMDNSKGDELLGKTLPSDVLYALQYRSAELRPTEILDLARNKFEHEGAYMLLKAARGNPGVQRALLQDLVNSLHTEPEPTNERTVLRNFIERNISKIPPDSQVAAEKLAQYSRQGFELWRKKYDDKAIESAQRSNPTFLIGHSTFCGISSFIKSHTDARKPLFLLVPSFIQRADENMCGYKIDGAHVEMLPKNFPRESGSILIDDTFDTGTTKALMYQFWTQSGKYPEPGFEFLSVMTK